MIGVGRPDAPSRRGWVERPRLLALLDAAADARLTLLSAPAGSGKTMLLRNWLAHQTTPHAWVTFSSGDDTPHRVATRVLTAVQRATTEVNIGPARTGIEHGTESDSTFMDAAHSTESDPDLAASITRFSPSPQRRLLLILDDIHVLADPKVWSSMATLVETHHPGIRLIVAGRTDPVLPLSRLRSRGELAEIRDEDLQLTLDESIMLLRGQLGSRVSQRDLELLHGRTEGWIAGLQLAASAMHGFHRGDGAFQFGGTHPHVLDYFADEVLEGLPDELLAFLKQTAVCQRFSAGLCNALGGRRDSHVLLRELRRRNLFLVPLDAESRWYRYHTLFAQVLARTLEDEAPESLEVLHHRAMQWHVLHGHMKEAVHHALAAGNAEAAASLIERQVDEMLWERGEMTELLHWLEALPQATLQSRPRLCLAHAWALALTGQLQTVEEPLHLVEQELEHPNRLVLPADVRHHAPTTLGPTARGEIAAVRAITAGLQIDTHRLRESSTEAVAFAPGNPFVRSIVALSRGRACDLSYDIGGAIKSYAEAKSLSERIGNVHIEAVATSRLAELWALQGELRQAADTHRQVLYLADEESHHHSVVSAIAHVGLGGLLYEWNDLVGAAHHFEEGKRLATAWGHLETLKGAYYGLSRVQYAQGASDAALELMRETEVLARVSNALRSVVWVHAMQARLNLALDNRLAAVRWVRTSPLSPDREPIRLFTSEYATLARVLIAQNQTEKALLIVQALLETATSENRRGLIVELRILESLALSAGGSLREAMNSLRKALALATSEGYLRTFLDEGEQLARLLDRASADSSMPEYLQTVLEGLPENRVEIGSGELPLSGALTPREREILQHIAAGESNVEIADVLVLSPSTVKRHVSNIFDKLSVTSRTQAVAQARRHGMLA